MDFEIFLSKIDNIQSAELPGETAQMLMAPYNRKTRDEALKLAKNPKESAVLILLYPGAAGTRTVLIERNKYSGVHSAQISFPGGRKEDSDISLMHTALREASEEVGLDISKVEVIKELTQLYIPPSNFLVQPYLAFAKTPQNLIAQPSEVAQIICPTIHQIFGENSCKNADFPTAYGFSVSAPYFDIDGHKVWGATAMILAELRSLLCI